MQPALTYTATGLANGDTTAAFTTQPTLTTVAATSNPPYSYIGIYGWATGAVTSANPSGCVEWYIVDDSFGTLPFNPDPSHTTSQGTAMIDGGTYTIYTRPTTGTGGNKCGSSVGNWMQYYSMRNKARTCGTISVSQHWAAWAATGNMPPGNMLESSVLVEVGGGAGSASFATANVTAN